MNIIFNKDLTYKVIYFFENEEKNNAVYRFAKEKNLFNAKAGETYFDIGLNGTNSILWGLGKKEQVNDEVLRVSAYKLMKAVISAKVSEISIELPSLPNTFTTKSVVEGLYHGIYKFDKFLTKKDEIILSTVSLKNASEQEANEAKILIDGIFLCRDIVNEPSINLYPETLADIVNDKLSAVGVDVTVYGRKEIENLGMKAFLAVAAGSSKEPKFIIMKYNGNPNSNEKIAFVGKGLTYDSGGYCIKPPSSMSTMHADMGGSGTVIGAIYSIAKANLKTNVIGIVAACENLISGDAYKTGDIIGSLSGKTIEVGNTDAEGRLTLADALYYVADVENPKAIIDFATLTGACVVALGEVYTGAVTNNSELMNSIKEASSLSGEKVWELPTDDEYRELIKSEVADLSNIGKNGAGCITAGLFLENFVKEIPWVHMDIAGTAYLSKPYKYLPKGATGIHVKTLFNLVKDN